MNWNIGQARDNLADVIKHLRDGPQKIYRHSTLAAVVVEPSEYEAFAAWRAQTKPPLAHALEDLQMVCAEAAYTLESHGRQDRPNAFETVDAD